MEDERVYPGTPGYKKYDLILQSLKLDRNADDFLYPVDVIRLGLTNYYDVIDHPMDLSTLEKNFKAGIY